MRQYSVARKDSRLFMDVDRLWNKDEAAVCAEKYTTIKVFGAADTS